MAIASTDACCQEVSLPAGQDAFLDRYAQGAPGYTAYPDATAFTTSFGPAQFGAALERSNAEARSVSLLVSLPFSRQAGFRDAGTGDVADADRRKGYLGHLEREMALVAGHLDTSRPIAQLYWDGTPTLLSLGQMSELIDRLDERFGLSVSPRRDYAIVIDPREADVLTLRHLQMLGFNRLSLDVGDLDPGVPRAMHGTQLQAQTEMLIDESLRLGFVSLNLALSVGLPHQTRASLAATLEQAIDLAPARLSLSVRHTLQPDDRTWLALLLAAMHRLTDAGYVHVGLGQFARPDDSLALAQRAGTLRYTPLGYTTHGGCDLIGLGVSAISLLDDHYAQNPDELAVYEAAIQAGHLATQRGLRLNAEDRLRRRAIQCLMGDLALDLDALGEAFGLDAPAYFADALARLEPAERDGLLVRHGQRLAVTPTGRLLLRHLAMAFDARQPGDTASPSRNL